MRFASLPVRQSASLQHKYTLFTNLRSPPSSPSEQMSFLRPNSERHPRMWHLHRSPPLSRRDKCIGALQFRYIRGLCNIPLCCRKSTLDCLSWARSDSWTKFISATTTAAHYYADDTLTPLNQIRTNNSMQYPSISSPFIVDIWRAEKHK